MLSACGKCKNNFEIKNKDLFFYDNISPFFNGVKYPIPIPKLCPDCRLQRRLVFRNDRNYYKRACTLCSKNIVSLYSEDKNFPVYCKDCFWNEAYDPRKYGMEYDFEKTLWEQLAKLRIQTPRIAIYNTQSENSDYTVHSSRNKNAYMSCSSLEAQDIFYTDWGIRCRDSSDLYICYDMELCYFCSFSGKCFHSMFLEHCTQVNESVFCSDCRNCNDCIGCVGLRGKNYYLFNTQVTREEYENYKKEIFENYEKFLGAESKYKALKKSLPKNALWSKNSQNCTGNYLDDSKDCSQCYNVKGVETGSYNYELTESKNAYDVARAGRAENVYEIEGAVELSYSLFCNLCYQSDNMIYCDNCMNSHYCFGCFGLKNSSYCILNKQYSKEEYEILVPKIIESMGEAFSVDRLSNLEEVNTNNDDKRSVLRSTTEHGQTINASAWGEFFPMSLSSYGYNETKAFDYFILTKNEALHNGLMWKDVLETENHSNQNIFSEVKHASQVDESSVADLLVCNFCQKKFKIILPEFQLYKKLGVWFPDACYSCRHKKIMEGQLPYHLTSTHCKRCNEVIETSYDVNSEVVYCEKCYLESVY